jgi:hypothetical protein
MLLFFYVMLGPHSFIDLGLGLFNQLSSSEELDQRTTRASCVRR